jgi:L-ribulose-5-phosphate 4-epimerase
MLETLKHQLVRANRALVECGLVTLTFGTASGHDADQGLVAIKPSGVDYDALTPKDIVVLDFDGNVVEGMLRPSSDAPTHLAIYRAYPQLGGIAHTHSSHAAIFAQAVRGIPCFGTTHADHFRGEVPVTRPLTQQEVDREYEANTGKVIVECFADRDPLEMPAVLVAHHGPFTWGRTPTDAVKNAIALEEVARTALGLLTLNPTQLPIPAHLRDKHFLRKHGPGAYYGQEK